MAYTATKYFNPRAFSFPSGVDNSQHLVAIRGNLVDCDTATEYSVGGIGSTSFEVTAFSAVGLVTYTALVGVPLVNGQKVVLYNFASNTNDGTYIVSAVTPSSTSAGTFVALPGPTAIAGSAQTTQTAEGVGQLQFGIRAFLAQTFTATAVTQSGGINTVTYTTLTGPQLWPGDKVTLAAMTNAGNNGTFSLNTVTPTSATGGSFTVTNASGVTTDSGTGKGSFEAGISAYNSMSPPVQVEFFTALGYVYRWDPVNYTIRVFLTGANSGAILSEAALAASVLLDTTARFEALFVRAKS
jgi:hypothetical protein